MEENLPAYSMFHMAEKNQYIGVPIHKYIEMSGWNVSSSILLDFRMLVNIPLPPTGRLLC